MPSNPTELVDLPFPFVEEWNLPSSLPVEFPTDAEELVAEDEDAEDGGGLELKFPWSCIERKYFVAACLSCSRSSAVCLLLVTHLNVCISEVISISPDFPLNWFGSIWRHITYLHFVLRFWNQVFTWASVIFKFFASVALSVEAKYFCLWNLFSSSHIWSLEKEVRGFFRFGGVRFWYGWPILLPATAANAKGP